MRAVQLPLDLLDRIVREARAAYPEEACGFLGVDVVEADAAVRSIRSVAPAANESEGERRRRFVILPDELRTAEARAGTRGEAIGGFYHSHPDHPAVPSAFDTEHAWPWYTYVVVSVGREGALGVGAFELDGDHRRFVACDLAVGAVPRSEPPSPAPAAASAGAGGD